MSILTPTQYGIAQYNLSGYNFTAISVNGSISLFDTFLTGDAISDNAGIGVKDIIRINEWLNSYLIKGSSDWNTPAGSSATWTTPPPVTTRQIWENANAPKQIP
jgi:hypothetical protein